ncbi:MAG: GFA family protein [Rhodospirillaceae bacterium]|nr:GFA family protein [Rhodospirillaceae bacterium]
MGKTAKCACGALTAAVTGEPAMVIACHCTECQRRTGTVYGVSAYYKAEQVAPAGPETRYVRTGGEGRKIVNHFCPTCGTTLYWTADLQPGMVGIAVGTFNDRDFPRPKMSIWENSRAAWVQLDAEIPGHTQGRASPPSR